MGGYRDLVLRQKERVKASVSASEASKAGARVARTSRFLQYASLVSVTAVAGTVGALLLGPFLESHLWGLIVGVMLGAVHWWREVGTDVRELRVSDAMLTLTKNDTIEREIPIKHVISVRRSSLTGAVTDGGMARSEVVEIEVGSHQGKGSSWVTMGTLRWFGYDGLDAVHEAIATRLAPRKEDR